MSQTSPITEQVFQLLLEEKPLSALKLLAEYELSDEADIQCLTNAIERILLREGDEIEGLQNGASHSLLLSVVLKACRFAANHPYDFRWVSQLADVLSVESCGHSGQSILTELAISRSDQVRISSMPTSESEDASADQFSEFFRRYINQLNPGVNRLSFQRVAPEQHLLTTERSSLYGFAGTLLKTPGVYASNKRQFYMLLLKAGVDLSHPTKQDPQDLRLIGIASEVLADNYDLTGAFELSFQALSLSTHSQHLISARYAWGILAETFLRARKYVNALICWNCATSIDEEVPPDIALRESITLIHTLLHLDLWTPADALLKIARARFQLTGLASKFPHYLIHIEAKIILSQALNEGASADILTSRLKPLLSPVSEIIKTRKYGGTIGAIASVFAAVIYRCKTSSHPISEEIQAKFDEIIQLSGESTASRYRTLASMTIGVHQLLELGANFSKGARTELGTDAWLLRTLAPRALSQSIKSANGRDALSSLELIADHRASASNGKSSQASILTHLSAAKSDGLDSEEWTKNLDSFARNLSNNGEHIEAIGLDSENRLVRVTVCNGAVVGPIVESRDIFDPAALELWEKSGLQRLRNLERFRSYGYDEVLRVVSKLGLSSTSQGAVTILLQGGRVATVPANLLVRKDGFAGERPLAVVPSLSWLRLARSAPRETTGKVAAWIANPDIEAAISPLRIINEYIHEWFSSVPIDRRWREHQDKAPDLVVVGAHGIVGAEGHFFRMLKDEQDRPMALNQLAETLRGSGVVVLLVCSAGKVGVSPYLSTNVSLPEMLLGNGCRSVVASPWPIDSVKAGSWLEFFVAAWNTGFSVVESTYFANDEMRRISSHPLDWLAMHVFGDPQVKGSAS
ncbi:CHAT domain-containing protein [Corallococcus exercitus]|uniref:CHAT domain-containing protein n=1 Tax=Corallococcus exercitus TaxID=2316736 RepID=UPI0035D459B2